MFFGTGHSATTKQEWSPPIQCTCFAFPKTLNCSARTLKSLREAERTWWCCGVVTYV